MTEPTRIRRSDGVVQGYHVGSTVTSNADARAAFHPRPQRFLPVEQCPSFAGAARVYPRGRTRLDVKPRPGSGERPAAGARG